MIRVSLFLLTVAFAALPSLAEGGTLFTGTLGINRSVNLFDINQFDLDIAFSDAPFSPTNLVRLFDDLVITPSNVGDTFEATAANDPVFLTAVQRLTDNSNEFIQTFLTENEPGGLTESQSPPESNFFLLGSPPVAPNPAEVTITSITLRIDKFVLLSNAAAGPGPPLDLSMTFSILGTPIPEPSTGWLFVSGLISFGTPWLLRRRRLQVLTIIGTLPSRTRSL